MTNNWQRLPGLICTRLVFKKIESDKQSPKVQSDFRGLFIHLPVHKARNDFSENQGFLHLLTC
ncbi:hypothetical protein INP51_07085 [Blautia liquoris]|uniref:Uncharacterized protein n=1 Tax=Blautia liquoris TaxID=2779518 RepID=A0A7M2RK50_9FIRM|nr:hypothetical protein [Blautia liquoris]QOV20685.1 hypothetical protein INP51_07085 [Blautia liquoris]